MAEAWLPQVPQPGRKFQRAACVRWLAEISHLFCDFALHSA